MDYLDFELMIAPGAAGAYPVTVARAPAGSLTGTMHFPFDAPALENRLQAVEIARLRAVTPQRDVHRPRERASLEAFGQALFEAVMPEAVRACYRASRQQALAEGKGLRLRLRIEAPDLAVLPWEFLYDPDEGDFICLSNETPVVRYLDLDRPVGPLQVQLPLQVLGMVASPSDRPTLDVEREKRRMEVALAGLRARGLVKVTWLEGQTWRALLKAMRQGPWHVFHFVGHGGFDDHTGEGLLALTAEDGTTFRLPATKLGRLLADHNTLRLAILNACEGAQASSDNLFSSTASILIRRGIPAVVAMQHEITDHAAIEFARSFYEALADSLPVDAAVAEARKSISLSRAETVEWATPVLHMRAPDGQLFDVAAAPEPASPAALPPSATVSVLQPGPPAPEPPALPPPAATPPPAAAPPPKRGRWKLLAGVAVLAVGAFLIGQLDGTDPTTPAGADDPLAPGTSTPVFEAEPAPAGAAPAEADGGAADLGELEIMNGVVVNGYKRLSLFQGDSGGFLSSGLEGIAGFERLGAEGCLLITPEDGTVALRSFMPGRFADLFAATSPYGIPGIDQDDVLEMGVEGFLYTEQQAGTVPLVLYAHAALSDVMVLSDPALQAQATAAGYAPVRTEGYVYPGDQCSGGS